MEVPLTTKNTEQLTYAFTCMLENLVAINVFA